MARHTFLASRSLPLMVALLLGSAGCPSDDVPPIDTTGEDSTTGDPTTTTAPVTVTMTATMTDTDDTATDTSVDSSGTAAGTDTDSMTTTSGPTCGDDVVDGDEQCDGTDLAGQDCASQGFDGGRLACADDCTFDTSGCTSTPVCGNDTIDGKDVCDGTDLGGQDCMSQGFDGGTLACLDDCTGYDTSGCTSATCEDEDIGGMIGPMVASGSTAAADNDLDGSCGGMGGNDHVVLFTAPADGGYIFDTFGSDYDTKLALFADCDVMSEIDCNDDAGGDLQSELLLDMVAGQAVFVVIDGFDGATGNFVLNISEAPVCGDGLIEGAEVCEGGDVGGATCADAGLGGGAVVACGADCLSLDASACNDPTGYGNCVGFPEADTCTAEEICATDGGPNGACVELDCANVAACGPAPATGTAPVACVDVTGDGTGDCILDCSAGQTCPDGMTCFFDALCLWSA
jgi:hypothetical protein